jgi:ATP-binding cassette subfamily B protein
MTTTMNRKTELLKRFTAYYRPHWKLFTLDIFCALMIAAADLVFPVISRHLMKEVIPRGNVRLLVVFTGALVVLYIITSVMHYIVNYWGHVVGVRMEYDMRRDLFSHLQTLSFKFYDDNRTGHLMSRMINDLNQVAELAHHGPEDIFISVVMLLGSFFILLGVEWRLTAIIYLSMPFLFWFTIVKRRSMSEAFKDVRVKIADVNADLENSISGIRVAKSFTNEEYEMDKFNRGNRKFKNSRVVAYKKMAEFITGINFLSSILNTAIIGIGGYFIYKRIMDVADLTAFLLYINMVMVPIRRLTNFAQQFEEAMAGFGRFTEIMEQKPDIKDRPDSIKLDNVQGEIEFRNVTFSYNKSEKVLNNINIKIKKGQTLALVGPSGGGKTTLCHLLPRFYEVDEGAIFIDGIDIKDIKVKSLRENIGLVQQDVFIFSGTIRDDIMYGRVTATDQEIIDAAKKANIHDFIETLEDGYDTYVGEKGVKLSGGQKQRISIARVFLKNPPILILDEATSSLDNETEIKIQMALDELAKGRTTIVIAHRLSTIRNADEIVVLTENGIEERGTHEELLKSGGIYSTLYNAQFRGYIPDFA